jgi:hypothetical protein
VKNNLLQLMAASVVFSTLALACGGESGEAGLEEPLRVVGGVFKDGALPGAPPDADATPDSLRLTTIETNNSVVHPGQAGKQLAGRATDNSYAVALRFEKTGSGYWVKPLGEADSAYPGELNFRTEFELAADLPLGPQRLLLTVIDEQGRAGRQQALTLCVTSLYDRNLHACDETKQPPAAVISLTWSGVADLDLVVRTPWGEIVDARNPSTETDPLLEDPDPNSQALLYSGDLGCDLNAAKREDLVWPKELAPGRYEVLVNLFDACGQAATFFQVSASARGQRDDGTYTFEPLAEPVVGQLLEVQTNPGRAQGLTITSFEFP